MKKTKTFLTWSVLTSANLFDARDYKIPNELIMLGLSVGLYFNVMSHGWMGIIHFLMKALVPILLLYLLYRFKGIGAADIKLFSVICTLQGIEFTTDVMVASVVLAFLVVPFIVIHEGRINPKRKLHYSFYITAAFFLLTVLK